MYEDLRYDAHNISCKIVGLYYELFIFLRKIEICNFKVCIIMQLFCEKRLSDVNKKLISISLRKLINTVSLILKFLIK